LWISWWRGISESEWEVRRSEREVSAFSNGVERFGTLKEAILLCGSLRPAEKFTRIVARITAAIKKGS
jgi:hypothetical protein